MMSRVLIAAAITGVLTGCQRSEPAPQTAPPVSQTASAEDFPTFWGQFRQAFLAQDVDRLVQMTRFPLEVRGDSDADPVVRQDRAHFGETVKRIIEQDSGQRAEPETVRQYVERTPSPASTDVEPDGGAARVGDLVFERIGARWLLVRVYVREPI